AGACHVSHGQGQGRTPCGRCRTPRSTAPGLTGSQSTVCGTWRYFGTPLAVSRARLEVRVRLAALAGDEGDQDAHVGAGRHEAHRAVTEQDVGAPRVEGV